MTEMLHDVLVEEAWHLADDLLDHDDDDSSRVGDIIRAWADEVVGVLSDRRSLSIEES